MKKIKHLMEYALLLLGAKLVQALSLEQAQSLARFFGRLAYYSGLAKASSLSNLRLAFPEWSEAERRKVARAAYEEFATTMIELCRMPVSRPEDLASYFEFEGLEIFDQLRTEKRAALCVSAHYGNWEWMGAALIAKGYPMTFMIGTQSNPYSDELFNRYRATVGIRYVRIRAIRDVIKILKEGGFMAVLGDQDGDKWGVITRFFGQEVSTHDFWLAPALRTGAAIVFGVPERLGARRHRLKIHRLPEVPEGLNELQAKAFLLQAYNDLLEQAIRARPSMWLWMHRRFRSKALHRLSGEERARAERGELVFDGARQAWLKMPEAEPQELQTWKI